MQAQKDALRNCCTLSLSTSLRSMGNAEVSLPVSLPLSGYRMRKGRVRRHEVLNVVTLAAVALSPRRLAGIEAEIGAADAVVHTRLGAQACEDRATSLAGGSTRSLLTHEQSRHQCGCATACYPIGKRADRPA